MRRNSSAGRHAGLAACRCSREHVPARVLQGPHKVELAQQLLQLEVLCVKAAVAHLLQDAVSCGAPAKLQSPTPQAAWHLRCALLSASCRGT